MSEINNGQEYDDLQIRKEFAKIFDWYEYKQSYLYSQQDKKLKEPSWYEIFNHIGKIQERSKEIIQGIDLPN